MGFRLRYEDRGFGSGVADSASIKIYETVVFCRKNIISTLRFMMYGMNMVLEVMKKIRGIRSSVCTLTSFQKRFFMAVPGFI